MARVSPVDGNFFEGQLLHLISLLILLAALFLCSNLPGFAQGSFLGLSTTAWAVLAAADAILHQVCVWICWRLELNGQRLTAILGGRSFRIYQVGFAILIVLRPILALALAWSNRGTLPIGVGVGVASGVVLLVPSLYLLYCVRKYFGFERAFGIDHFDASWRTGPLVREGIFSWTPNAMYVFGFLILWVPAFLFQSVAAIVLAGFSHLYIWVHYYCTEKPDLKRIYG